MGSAFLLNVFIGIYKGVEDLGVFNQALAFYTILSTFFAVGLNNTIIKKIAEADKDNEKANRTLSSSLLMTLLISGTFSFAAILVAKFNASFFSNALLAEVVVIPFITLPLFNLNKNFMAYNSGMRNQKQFAIARIVRWIAVLTYVLIALINDWSLLVIMYAFPVSEGLLFVYHLINIGVKMKFTIKKEDLKANLSFGLKSYVAEVIAVLTASMDVILIGYFLTNAEVGIYSFILFFAKTLYVFPGILMQNINPVISNLWGQQKLDELKIKISKVRKVNLLVISAQLIVLLIAYKLVIMFIKQEFVDTYFYFIIAVVGVFIFATISWSGSILVMTGKLKENTLRTSAIIILTAASTIGMTYFFGLMGSVIAVSLNGIIAYVMLAGFIHRVLGIKVGGI